MISYIVVFVLAIRLERKKYISQQQVWKSPMHNFLAPPPLPALPSYDDSNALENAKWMGGNIA